MHSKEAHNVLQTSQGPWANRLRRMAACPSSAASRGALAAIASLLESEVLDSEQVVEIMRRDRELMQRTGVHVIGPDREEGR